MSVSLLASYRAEVGIWWLRFFWVLFFVTITGVTFRLYQHLVYADTFDLLLQNFSFEVAFGTTAFILHLLGYYIYGREVMRSHIRPNVATWLMWLFGGVVELITYNAIFGAHWTSSALPLACTIGIAGVCITIAISQYRCTKNNGTIIYHPPERGDYYLMGFDSIAGGIWLMGFSATLANMVAVSTSIATFIPIWRTTYLYPQSENTLPWVIWSLAYLMMIGAIATGENYSELGLYFYPVYYLMLHGIVALLAIRTLKSAPSFDR